MSTGSPSRLTRGRPVGRRLGGEHAGGVDAVERVSAVIGDVVGRDHEERRPRRGVVGSLDEHASVGRGSLGRRLAREVEDDDELLQVVDADRRVASR